jgi:5'-nucleotidase
VNPGWNVGASLIHSGTFGAAMTAAVQGVPSVAVSLDHRPDAEGYVHWWTAASLAAAMVDDLASRSLPHGAYNLNVPNVPLHRLRGVRQTELAPLGSLWSLDVETDNHVITVTPIPGDRRAPHGTDVAALRAGFASVSVFDGLVPKTIPVRALCDLVGDTIDDNSRRAAMARNAHNAISSLQASVSGAAPQ